MTFHPDSLPDLTGKVYIVTGGNSGIGYHTVARLAQHGAHVYLCSRSPSKASTAITSIKTLYPTTTTTTNTPLNITPLILDHLSLPTIVSAVSLFLSHETALHGLINNAGIMAAPYSLTQDGYECQWQTNHIAHWLLTSLLLPVMLETSKSLPPGSVRIVNLSSSGHHYPPKGGINFDDTALKSESAMTRYGQSKLANVLHVKMLHRLYGPGSPSAKKGEGEIWVSAVHPGFVETNIGEGATQMPKAMRWVAKVFTAVGGRMDADRGSWTSVFCAAGEMRREECGGYWQRIAEKGWQSGMAKDERLAERLEEWTKGEMMRGGWISR